MHFVARLCFGFVLSSTTAFMLPVPPAAAQGAPKAPAMGNPPPGGEALYRWCRYAVFVKYGQTGVAVMGSGAKPGQKLYVMLDDNQIDPMIDFCVRNKGQQY